MKRVYKLGVIGFILLFCSLIISSLAIANASSDIKLKIAYNNLAFEDNVYILYAVDSDGIENKQDIQVLVWYSAPSEYNYGTQDKVLSYDRTMEINGKDYPIFVLDTLSAKQMTDEVFAVAYYDGNYSAPNKYSILQYAKNKIGTTGNENLKDLLVSMLDYGSKAQTYFNYKTETLANDIYYTITVSGGNLSDGFKKGLYKSGQEVTLIAGATKDGVPFDCWKNETGAIIGTQPSITITVGEKDEIYSAVYTQVSVGLEFESNEDGTCALIGIGDCTDTDIIIPTRSSDGDLVTSIDSAAFRNESITSITIPVCIEEIGRNAFNGCSALTDVYYEGTTTQWENIDIKSGNAPLINATLHTTGKFYTVTFIDYNGTELKQEQVLEGTSATAPNDPIRDGYNFVGWNKSFDNITEDITVTAVYEFSVTNPTFIVEQVDAQAGQTNVEVKVLLKNNPGISSIALSIAYDTSITLTGFTYNGEIGGQSTPYNANAASPKLVWVNWTENVEGDWVFSTLTFNVNENASGAYNISISYNAEDIYDVDENNINFDIINGGIVVA